MKSVSLPRNSSPLPGPVHGFDHSTTAGPTGDAKFRALVENSSEVVSIVTPDGVIFYTTPSVQRVLGYDPVSWIGTNGFDLLRPEQAALVRVALRQLTAAPTGTHIRVIVEVRHQNGTWRWVDAALTNLIGVPDIGGIVCNYRDVTESRHAVEALRASEQRYRLLAEALPEMISIRDAEGRIEYCNSHWCEYRGIDSARAITHDWTTDMPPEDIAALRPPVTEHGVPDRWEAECRLRRASDGALRWHSVRIITLPAEGAPPNRWLAITSDIHERKQAEQERERLLAQLDRERSELAAQYAVVHALARASSLADAAPALLATLCEQLGWQAGALWALSTPAATRPALSLIHLCQQPEVKPAGLFAQARPSPPRRGLGLAGRVWEERKPLSTAPLSSSRGAAHHRAAARAGLRGAFAFPIIRAGEVHGVIELFSREPAKPGGRLLEIVAAAGIQIGQFMERTDALERLRLSEEALIQANNALERRVRERTAELHEANRELSSEIAERTRLERQIIRISEREQRRIGQDLHDGVCQELAAIAFMTRAMANRLAPTTCPEKERFNQVARHLNDTIARCRDIARGLHPVEMDSDGLMVALRDLARRADKTIACSFQCEEPILMPESDTALNLYRIAQEAVNNAIKYSRARHIAISLAREGQALRLSIADDGRGILPRSAPSTRKRNGMGLSIMRYRARTMAATLRVLRRRPHGAEIVCLLPHR